MRTGIFLVLYFGLIFMGVSADNDNDVKRGAYPFMAFIYFSDPTIVDVTGARFVRSAVLIQPDWLITSALGPTVIDTPNGFPKKTLLARMGAVTIDNNITLNEDEDEQEQEVIQVVRPYNHSATRWWITDISLLKTLLPFNMTSAVAVKPLNFQRQFDYHTCIILFYQREFSRDNSTNEKTLKQMLVELIPGSIDYCGIYYVAGTMTCATDIEDQEEYGNSFCHGNSGGPLICENEVFGLQTYIENDCQKPHLYQLVSAWDNFITCGVEDKCHEDKCRNVCDVKYKDPLNVTETRLSGTSTSGNVPVIEMFSGTTKEEVDLDENMISTKTRFTDEHEKDPLLIPGTTKGVTEENVATIAANSTTSSIATTTTTTAKAANTAMTTSNTTAPTTAEPIDNKFPKEKNKTLKQLEAEMMINDGYERSRLPSVQRQHLVRYGVTEYSSVARRNISIVDVVLLGLLSLACLNYLL